MNRKAFFASLSALLVTITGKAQTTLTPCRAKLTWGNQLPLCNGQCPNPECNHWAEPFPAKTQEAIEAFSLPRAPETFYQSWYLVDPKSASPNPLVRTGPRLNRCPKCNTAFWQDPLADPA